MKTTLVVGIVALLMVTSVLAATPPSLQSTTTLPLASINPVYWQIVPITNDVVAIQYSRGSQPSSCYMDVYSLTNGNLLYRDINTPSLGGGCFGNYLDYKDGVLVSCQRFVGVSAAYPANYMEAYDVSDLGFISSLGASQSPNTAGTASCQIIDTYPSGQGIATEVTTIAWSGAFPYNNYLTQISSQGTFDFNTLYNGSLYTTRDFVNDVGVTGTSFYDFSEIDNQVLFDSITAGSIVDWDRNIAYPQYVTTDGRLSNVGGSDYNDVKVSGSGLDFSPVFIVNSSYIVGVENGLFVIGDMSETTNPARENTSVVALNYNTGKPHLNVRNDERLFFFNESNNQTSVYSFPLPDFVVPEENQPPEYNIEFLGTDFDRDNFVFKVGMTDVDGGRTYTALDLNLFPDDYTDEQRQYQIQFSTEADLANSYSFCMNTDFFTQPGWNFQTVIDYSFYPSGAMLMAETQGNYSCLTALDYFFPETIKRDQLTFDKIVDFSTEFYNPSQPNSSVNDDSETYFSVMDSRDRYIMTVRVQTIDEFPSSSNTTTIISYWNPTTDAEIFVYNQSNAAIHNEGFRMYVEFDFENGDIDVEMVEGGVYSSLANWTVDMPAYTEDINSIKINPFLGGDIYVNYIDISYDIDIEYPDYKLFGTLQPNVELYNSLLEPITGGFGSYKATLWGTDDGFGFNYYENPVEIDFQYDENTKALSAADINQEIQNANSNAPIELIEGDWITAIYNFFERYGIKSEGSRFLLALFVWMLITMPVAAQAGSEVGIIAGIIAFVMLAYIGLFPTWFIIMMIIVAAALMAVAVYRLSSGGGNGGGGG